MDQVVMDEREKKRLGNAAIASFILGISCLLGSSIISRQIIGIYLGRKGLQSDTRGLAIAGIAMCIASTVLYVGVIILFVVLFMMDIGSGVEDGLFELMVMQED